MEGKYPRTHGEAYKLEDVGGIHTEGHIDGENIYTKGHTLGGDIYMEGKYKRREKREQNVI